MAHALKNAGFRKSLPTKASPSPKYFWSARRGTVKKAQVIRLWRLSVGEVESLCEITARMIVAHDFKCNSIHLHF